MSRKDPAEKAVRDIRATSRDASSLLKSPSIRKVIAADAVDIT